MMIVIFLSPLPALHFDWLMNGCAKRAAERKRKKKRTTISAERLRQRTAARRFSRSETGLQRENGLQTSANNH